mmetsp:Transcript_6922/g.13341  ORF Transcript_6922/g.13341 Transcript_6922/m.13341 type:complete len:156 (+) Transcript_6922:7-474(+)
MRPSSEAAMHPDDAAAAAARPQALVPRSALVALSLVLLALVSSLPSASAFSTTSPRALLRAPTAPVPATCLRSSGAPNPGDANDDTYRHDTGRQHAMAEGLDANEMSESEFREAMKAKMEKRRRMSKGAGESNDYMAMLQGQPVQPKEIDPNASA